MVSYAYDDNGSLTEADGGTVTTYTYNLQNRMDSVTVGANPTITYEYNPDGIRVQKKVGSANPINYLIDPSNHTGYAQVFKQTQADSDDVAFIIGHDVMAQATGTTSPVFMIYDGHGSTRQLADNSGAIVSGQNYNYDAYGNIINAVTPQTDLLYSGEWRDTDIDLDYLRSRWLRTTTGRFTQRDSYPGSKRDPITLHKYLYCNSDPVNRIDPSGNFATGTMSEVSISMAIAQQIQVGASIVVSYHAYSALKGLESSAGHSIAKRIVKEYVQTVPEPFTQEAFEELQNRINRTRFNTKKSIYLHYSFKNIAHLFGELSGLKAPSWCTKTVYPTGWHAKYYLALFKGGPRNAIYIVLPYDHNKCYYGKTAKPKQDTYPPNFGNWLRGGGQQWHFPFGTDPGTVFGPIPIPEGSLNDTLGGIK